jgi:hypothetical protein
MIRPNRQAKNIADVPDSSIDAAFRRATRDALLAHKQAGVPIAVWRDGKVVTIPAEEIEIPPLDEAASFNDDDSAAPRRDD